jgi:hypothetical protein
MKYQVGDIVVILHSNEEGRIIDIISDKMVTVDVNGVSFPVYMDQIDFPYFRRFTQKKLFPQKKEKKFVDDLRKEKKNPEVKKDEGVFLSILPVMDADEFGDEIVKELKLSLVNQNSAAYKFSYRQNFLGRTAFSFDNTILPFSNFYLHDIDFEDMNDNPSFEFDFSQDPPDGKKADHFEVILKIKPKQLFSRIEELRKKNEANFSYKLFDEYPGKPVDEKYDMDKLAAKGYKVYDAKKAKEHIEAPRSVVDLHIEKITDDWKSLSNYEILRLQLKTFEKYYDLALSHMQPGLVVIHGVGEGKLRDEIHDILRLKKEVKSFVNQYDPRFGYGATEIFFQY